MSDFTQQVLKKKINSHNPLSRIDRLERRTGARPSSYNRAASLEEVADQIDIGGLTPSTGALTRDATGALTWDGSFPSTDFDLPLGGDGQVLTANGLGGYAWEDVDGGSGFPGGAEYITHLLHFDGADGSTDMLDELGTTWINNGGVALETDNYKFGDSACTFDGVDDYLSATITALGSGDITIEQFLRPSANTAAGVWGFEYTGGGDRFSLRLSSGVAVFKVEYTLSGLDKIILGTTPVPTGSWTHIAVTRSSGLWTLYVAGEPQGTTTDNHAFLNTEFYIGRERQYLDAGYRYYSGEMDEFVTWNTVKYTGAFIPPTVPYTLQGEIRLGTRIRFRRGAVANLPDLISGEPFVETDTGILHVGPFQYLPST